MEVAGFDLNTAVRSDSAEHDKRVFLAEEGHDSGKLWNRSQG
jgi:hypothetical protein